MVERHCENVKGGRVNEQRTAKDKESCIPHKAYGDTFLCIVVSCVEAGIHVHAIPTCAALALRS